MKKINVIVPIKMTLAAVISLVLSTIVGIQYGTVASVISVLSIQETRRKSFEIGKKRVLACIIGQILSIIIFILLGQNPISFGIVLITLILVTIKLDMEVGAVPSIVLCTHILVAENINLNLIINEFLLIIIGVGVALIINLFMPSVEDKFKKDIEKIEESYKKIFNNMANCLLTQTVEINEQKDINEIEIYLTDCKKTAYYIVNNNIFNSSSYYTDYINMRINQFDTIKKIRVNFERFTMPLNQMKHMSELLFKISNNIATQNDCIALLIELESLKCEYRQMSLPKTREEFENRAQLLNMLNDIEDFLNIKKNFIDNLI